MVYMANYIFSESILIYIQHYDNKWCNKDLYGADHTMCKYDEDKPGPNCGHVVHRGVDDVRIYLQPDI